MTTKTKQKTKNKKQKQRLRQIKNTPETPKDLGF